MVDPSYSASVRIAATAERVWAVIADPAQHHRFDDTGMVGEAISPGCPAAVGDVFTMQMSYRDGQHVEQYRTDNHVTVLEPERCIEWTVAPQGGDPLGWHWRYTIEPGDDACTVTLTYDWTDAPAVNIERFGVPLVDESGLAASLDRLAAAVLDPGD